MATAEAVKERGILFSPAMVRALLDGRKTQTRRMVKPQPSFCHQVKSAQVVDGFIDWIDETGTRRVGGKPCPYGVPGDRLWVRENHWRHGYVNRWAGSEPIEPHWVTSQPDHESGFDIDRYVRFEDPHGGDKYCERQWVFKPSIHMPRWASRITLEVVSVRVERVQDISEEDAIAEGIVAHPPVGNSSKHRWGLDGGDWHCETPRLAFLNLFYGINKRASCDENPWVWAIEFRRVPS